MSRTWAAKVPVVTVSKAAQPKTVTIILPYYLNAEFFAQQIAGWRQYPADLRAHVEAIVVDDGSPVPAVLPETVPFPMRLFRIEVDRRWNWLAARNIGAHHAPEGWLLLTDMDHVVPADTLQALVYGAHDPAVVYGFSRVEHTGAVIHPHSASWLMTRAMFWRIGGYDERFSGFYGSDGIYRRRLQASALVQILTDRLIRYERVSDASTTAYLRKEPRDAAALQAITRGLPLGAPPITRSFPYHEVPAC